MISHIYNFYILISNRYRDLVGLFNSATEASNNMLLFSVRVLASHPLAVRVLGSLSLALRCALYFSSCWWVVRTNVGTITWWSTRCRNHESNVSFYQSLQHFLQSLWRLNTFLTNWHSFILCLELEDVVHVNIHTHFDTKRYILTKHT